MQGNEIVRANADFTVTWDQDDGTLASLVLNDDPDRMNWIEGTAGWGQMRLVAQSPGLAFQNSVAFRFTGLREEGEWVVSSYAMADWETLRAEVRRRVTAEALEEEYTFFNDATWPIYFRRGDLGILATFNDSYGEAAECVARRCHAHIWCGGGNSWVHALKMGPFPTELALVLQKGDLDAYSVRRHLRELSNDRGDFELHPGAFTLKGGKSKTIAWKVAAHPAGKFGETLLRLGGIAIDFRQETIFPGETFEIDVTGPDGTVRHHSRSPDSGIGEYAFEFEAGGKRAKALGYCSPTLGELLERRVRFIVRKQQCLDKDSPLHGAYLIYDTVDGRQYSDYRFRDFNACRERFIMGITVARWLRTHDDPEARASLDLFEAFVRRECYDTETGVVFDTIGKNPEFKRLYNGPAFSRLWLELFHLTRDPGYLDDMEKTLNAYYEAGGERFYAGGDIPRASPSSKARGATPRGSEPTWSDMSPMSSPEDCAIPPTKCATSRRSCPPRSCCSQATAGSSTADRTSSNSSRGMSMHSPASTGCSPTTSGTKSPFGTGTATGSGATGCSATRCTSTAPSRRRRSSNTRKSPARRSGASGRIGAFATASSCSGPTERGRPPGCCRSRRHCLATTASRLGRASLAKAPTHT